MTADLSLLFSDDPEDAYRLVREVFAPDPDPIPRDIVPYNGPTREDYLRWNDAAGTWQRREIPWELWLGPHSGTPAMLIAPDQPYELVFFGGASVTVEQLAKAGLTPEDVPKLTIITAPGRSTHA